MHAIQEAHVLLICYVHASVQPANILEHDGEGHADDEKCNGQAGLGNNGSEPKILIENYRND